MGSSVSLISPGLLAMSLAALERVSNAIDLSIAGFNTDNFKFNNERISLQELLAALDCLIDETGFHNLALLLGAESSLATIAI